MIAIKKSNRILLLTVVLFHAAGCLTPLRIHEKVTICESDGACIQKSFQEAQSRLHETVSDMLSFFDNKDLMLCEASEKKHTCNHEGIRVYWQGAQMPGIGRIKGLKLFNFLPDKSQEVTDLKSKYLRKDWWFIPFACMEGEGKIGPEGSRQLLLQTSSYCIFGGIPFVMAYYMSIDYVDPVNNIIGGNYKLTGWGLATGGGGTGYAMLRMNPKQDDGAEKGAEIENDKLKQLKEKKEELDKEAPQSTL